MSENQKFLTRGVMADIPSWLTNLMWHMVLTMEVESKNYLQVFTLTKRRPVSTSSTSRNSRCTVMNSMYRVTMW